MAIKGLNHCRWKGNIMAYYFVRCHADGMYFNKTVCLNLVEAF